MANGVVVPPLQSSTNAALIVVGSSKVVAVKFGVAAAAVPVNELVSPVTRTGAPTVEFDRSKAPVPTTYWLADAPDPVSGETPELHRRLAILGNAVFGGTDQIRVTLVRTEVEHDGQSRRGGYPYARGLCRNQPLGAVARER